MKVLVVVEDDHDMQLLIALTLSADPRLEVTGRCATAAEAVAEARRLQPALVILDHFIDGDVMGLQAAPAIKAAAPNASILLFTSHDLEVEASREPSLDGFLLKRDIAQLMPTVQRMLGLDPIAA
jgi:DNA-binding NarL/FixJ family response regulator